MPDLCGPWAHPLLGPLQSRVVMSAMTRNFAAPDHSATPAMADYYALRARHRVGLILTEGTIVDPSGDGYRDVPYIYDQGHVESWQRVTSAVHAEGGRIFCQLWHCGRISHPDFLGGAQPVSSSAQQAEGVNRQNNKPFGVPRALARAEIPAVVEMFRRAAGQSLRAGFDGVELHLGHGYLADQFFDDRINDRRDDYGGSVENRCRFALEVVAAVLAECGAARVMARISPARMMGGLYEWQNVEEMLAYLVPAFDSAGLRLLDVSCAQADYFAASGRLIRLLRPYWPHALIGGASLSATEAQAELDAGLLGMITYGRFLLANPDLVERLRTGAPLRPYDRALLATLD